MASMRKSRIPLAIGGFFIALYIFSFFFNDENNHRYYDDQEVILWVNKVGPLENPQETYLYYDLPFCAPDKGVESTLESLGEALQGYELRKSAINIFFKKLSAKQSICTKVLTAQEAELFKNAVDKEYWYQLFLDDLPIWGMIGDKISSNNGDKKDSQPKKETFYIYTQKEFDISYNGNHIIEVKLTVENPVPILAGVQIEFFYSVRWYPTDMPFHNRFEKYLDNNFFEDQIHWFSIFNSFMIVIFLTGLVVMILMRTLRNDYARYSYNISDQREFEVISNRGRMQSNLSDKEPAVDDIEDDLFGKESGEESGWKLIHGDVFRAPLRLALFSALLATGEQLAVAILFVILCCILVEPHADRGRIVNIFIVCYTLSSFVGGFGGSGFYARNEGKRWIRCMLLICVLFPGTCLLITLLLNIIAQVYGSSSAVPLGSMFTLFSIWLFFSVPLTFAGTLVGRKLNGSPDNPCRINPVHRSIPDKKWFLYPGSIIVLGGILPFASIFIEMYFIFSSFWQYKYYYVYGFMLLVYIILLIVTICVTIVSTYFLLNAEDYHWQWTAFLSASSTSIYVFLYGIYYFFFKTRMTGFFQTCFYFGYMFMFCISLGILCGAVGFFAASLFVKKIYHYVKVD